MNAEGTPNVILLASSLCAGGAVFALALVSLRAYASNEVKGRRLDDELAYDAAAGPTPLPRLFRAYRLGVPLLPLVRRLRERDSLGVRARLADYERRLVKVGLRPYITAEHFLTLCIVSGVVWGLLMSALTLVLGFGPVAVMLSLVMWAAAGLTLPTYMLNQLIAERVAFIEKRLPYATGFMLLALEANASLPMAIRVYCDEMENDPLASELRIVLSDIEKGLSTQEALSGLDERVRVDLLSSFILAVNTGLATGQPIKDIMQTQAAVTRRKRYESAEEVAKKASTKATFPLVLIVLAVLLLLLGPLMLNFSESFL